MYLCTFIDIFAISDNQTREYSTFPLDLRCNKAWHNKSRSAKSIKLLLDGPFYQIMQEVHVYIPCTLQF